MPPGTPEVVYEVLEPGVKPLGSSLGATLGALAVPLIKLCSRPAVPLTHPREIIKPPPPRPAKAPEAPPTPFLAPEEDVPDLVEAVTPTGPMSILHAPPSSPFDLHGTVFDEHRPAEPSAGSERGPWRSMHEGGAWLRALGTLEMLMAVGGSYGSLNTVQAVRLSAPCPLLPQDVRAALTVVARRTELLQACVAWRWAWPWFRRRQHVSVPFRVASGPVMAAYYRLLETPYDMSRGPLWRACLVPESRGPGGEHRAVLVLAVHHCLTDAFTNSTLCREVLAVLNAALASRRYLPPLRPLPPPLSDQLLGLRDYLAAAAFTTYKFLSPTICNFNKHVYFRGAVPRPDAKQARRARTRLLHMEMTEEATTQLRQRCRDEGVTVHALVCAAAQVAILHTAGSFGSEQPKEACVRVFNCVNLRRYFRVEDQEALGCHISIEEEEARVTLADGASGSALWALARRGHKALRASLNEERRPMRTLASFAPCSLLIPLNHLLTRLGLPNLNDNHVITTNMGDLQHVLPRGAGPVTPTHLLRCASDPYTGHPYTLVLHTFLGRFSLAIEYYSTKTAPFVANTFFVTLRDLLLDLAATGAPQPQGGPHRHAATHHDKFCPDDDDDDPDYRVHDANDNYKM